MYHLHDDEITNIKRLNQSQNMHSMKILCLPLLFVVSVQGKCPRYQVPHTVDTRTVCCKPVFNCQMDHEIHFCDEDGDEDICRPCPGSFVNKYVSSSLDEIHHTCFNMTTSHKDCPIGDTHPVIQPISCDAMFCRCKTEECRFGDVCRACELRKDPCGKNEEMNETGDCVACKALMSSPAGCGPCQYNETLWRLQQETLDYTVDTTETRGKVTSKVVTVKTEAEEGMTKNMEASAAPNNGTDAAGQEKGKEEKNGDGVSITVVIIIIVVLVFVGVAVALALYIKKKIKNGDETSKVVVCYRKMCKSKRANYQGGQQDPEAADMNGDVLHDEQTEPKVQAVKPLVRNTEEAEVTENGACGGVESEEQAMSLLKDGKDGDEETEEKGK